MNMHVCFMKSVHSGSKMPIIITIYGADIEMKYSQVIQCYHVNKEFLVECILKENQRSCVTPIACPQLP